MVVVVVVVVATFAFSDLGLGYKIAMKWVLNFLAELLDPTIPFYRIFSALCNIELASLTASKELRC